MMKSVGFYIALILVVGSVSARTELIITHKDEKIRFHADDSSTVIIDPASGAMTIELLETDFSKLRELMPEEPQRFEQFESAEPVHGSAFEYRSTRSFQTLSRLRPLTEFSPQELRITSLDIHRENIDADLKGRVDFSNGDFASLPFAAENSLLLKLSKDLTPRNLTALLSEYRLELLKVFPEIQSIHVRTDLSRFTSEDSGNSPKARLGSLADVIRFYRNDPRIKAVAPDLLIDSQRLPTTIKTVDLADTEVSDWGIADIGAPDLWKLPRALDGAVIGLVDTGFARHKDLVFAQTPLQMEIGDHGTHVAGIACARHGNGTGIRGVLPNCFVVPRAEPLVRYQGQTLDRYVHLFSQFVGDLNEITRASNGVHVFNVSLGYNWKRNMGINPETYAARDIPLIVANHGEFVVSILKNAAALDMVVYSAAGNDSDGDRDWRSARYASPFNWAAIALRERGQAKNAFIIEAHDREGERAEFSNIDGHLSCPGVDILSTVAQGADQDRPGSLYGLDSGTSMAAPYCAAGHLLLSLVRPRYSNLEIAECLLKSGEPTNIGVPRVRLNEALKYCPERAN